MPTDQLTELEAWFKQAPKPKGPIQLNQGVTISNYDLFLKTSFTILNKAPDAKINEPVWLRLFALKKILEDQALAPDSTS